MDRIQRPTKLPPDRELTDVYDEVEDTISLWLSDDNNGSVIIDDAPTVDGGTFNVIIENQQGRPVLHAWREEDFSNDPWLSIYLDTGEARYPGEMDKALVVEPLGPTSTHDVGGERWRRDQQ